MTTIILSALATCVGFITIVVIANIWEVSRTGYIAARWAIALWMGTVTAALFGAAWLSIGYQ